MNFYEFSLRRAWLAAPGCVLFFLFFIMSYLKSYVFALNELFIAHSKRLEFFAIRGSPKSGTNWLGNLLKLHPEISVTGECAFNQMAEGREYILQEAIWSVVHHPYLKGALDQSFEGMIKKLMIKSASLDLNSFRMKCLGDKTPAKAYPPVIKKSKCLYIVRDIRDVVVSRAYHLLRVGGTWGLSNSSSMLRKLESYSDNLQYFKDHPEELLDDVDWVRSNAKAWAESLNQVLNAHELGLTKLYPSYNVKIVRYEDLHRDVEYERKSCYTFLGVDHSKALPVDSGNIKTSPGFSIERPQEFNRKGCVGDWKNYFSEASLQAVMDEASGPLERLGYSI